MSPVVGRQRKRIGKVLHAFCFLCAVTAATSILSVGCAGREASRPEYCLVSELLESAERDQEVRRIKIALHFPKKIITHRNSVPDLNIELL